MAAQQKNSLQVRFGRLVASNRITAGLNQAQLAELSGLAVDTVAKLETAATGASFETIEKLATALQVDPAQLFTTELGGKPFERRAFTDFLAEISKLKEPDLLWLTEVVQAALKPRR